MSTDTLEPHRVLGEIVLYFSVSHWLLEALLTQGDTIMGRKVAGGQKKLCKISGRQRTPSPVHLPAQILFPPVRTVKHAPLPGMLGSGDPA